MPPEPGARWRRRRPRPDARSRLAARAGALRDELMAEAASSASGGVDPVRLQELQQTIALLSVEALARASPAARRLPMALLLIASALAVALLMFTRRGSAEVFASVKTSGVTARLGEAFAWAGPVRTDSLSLARYDDLRAPFLDGLVPAPAETAARLLTLKQADGCEGSMTVELPGLKVGDVVGLHAVGTKRVRITGPAPTPGVVTTLTGCWQVLRPGAPPATVRLTTPQRLSATAGVAGLDLILEPRPVEQSWLATPLRVSALNFHTLDERDAGNGTLVRQMSTLTAGTVQFEELANRVVRVRPGEALRWAALTGDVLELRSGEAGIELALQGEVQGLRTGSVRHPRDLMPTWLDWLRDNQAASLYWAAVISGFGMLAAVRRWWKS